MSAPNLQSEHAGCRADAEREAAKNIGEPVLANVHPIGGGHERPAQTEGGGLDAC